MRARAPVGIRRASCIGPSHCGGLPACAGSARHVENSCCGRQCHVRRAIGARRRVGGSAVPTVGRQSLSVGVASAPGGRAAGAACRVASCKCVAVRFLSCTAWSSGVGGEARAPPEALERGACATGRRASREKSTCTRRNARKHSITNHRAAGAVVDISWGSLPGCPGGAWGGAGEGARGSPGTKATDLRQTLRPDLRISRARSV